MLFTSLSQVVTGLQWETPARLVEYGKLYYNDRPRNPIIKINWYRRITNFWQDALWGDVPSLSSPVGDVELAPADLNVLIDASKWRSIAGYGVLVRNAGTVRSINSVNYRPVVDPADKTLVTGHIIGMPYRQDPSPNDNDDAFPDRIRFWLIEASGGGQQVDFHYSGATVGALIESVDIPDLFCATFGDGVSDYTDVFSVVKALENTISRRHTTLRRFSSPHIYGPPGATERQMNEEKRLIKQVWEQDEDGTPETIYFPVSGGDEKVEYLVWDADLDASFNHENSLLDSIHVTTSIPLTAFGLASATGDSGVSRERQMVSALRKARRLRVEVESALVQTYGITGVEWPEHPFGVTSYDVDNALKLLAAGVFDTEQVRRYLGYS